MSSILNSISSNWKSRRPTKASAAETKKPIAKAKHATPSAAETKKPIAKATKRPNAPKPKPKAPSKRPLAVSDDEDADGVDTVLVKRAKLDTVSTDAAAATPAATSGDSAEGASTGGYKLALGSLAFSRISPDDANMMQYLRTRYLVSNPLDLRTFMEPKGNTRLGNKVGLDCEMVGVGPGGRASALARVVVVNLHGHVVLDLFVKPEEEIVDYRTRFSGIRPQDLEGPHVVPLHQAQVQVGNLLTGRIVIGHDLKNDFAALNMRHPRHLIRDTARFQPLREAMKMRGRASPSLRALAACLLGLAIQVGEHHPGEDARAAVEVYRAVATEWEAALRSEAETKRREEAAAVAAERLRRKSLAAERKSAGGAGTEEDAADDGDTATDDDFDLEQLDVPTADAGAAADSATATAPISGQSTRAGRRSRNTKEPAWRKRQPHKRH
ncbi:hypothetical protein H696_00463 [Fonticula alba]|uniref:RNA exonuclease 4 n=1 Tax=Fonticula alba TaxID=691883 RepID=A0A058ZHD5_FONAL|nr:hypothetical protein H696_00463 [Fonticula alba]KCV72892.1 hypothetical protein H696_00463 [Fonticula alba]|eukprot:XP_009492593.1 hypothetical protein H696_00463 [Fonticula alba]